MELAAALEVPTVGPSGGVAIPWAALLEKRAYTTTTQNDGPEMQRPILQRLFGPSIMGMLGVRMDTIPQGRAEWPLFTTGVAPDQTKEGTAATAAVAATFTFATLKPKKNRRRIRANARNAGVCSGRRGRSTARLGGGGDFPG